MRSSQWLHGYELPRYEKNPIAPFCMAFCPYMYIHACAMVFRDRLFSRFRAELERPFPYDMPAVMILVADRPPFLTLSLNSLLLYGAAKSCLIVFISFAMGYFHKSPAAMKASSSYLNRFVYMAIRSFRVLPYCSMLM